MAHPKHYVEGARNHSGVAQRWLRLCAIAVASVLSFSGVRAEQATVLAIRSLSAEEARKSNPVEVIATVIFEEGQKNSIFIQDGTAGTYVHPEREAGVQIGDQVKVRGYTGFGLYLPGVEQGTFQVLRHGDLPLPTPATYADLLSGRLHYQRVSVEGIVHAISASEEGRTRIQLALGNSLLDVRVYRPVEKPEALIDSRVKLQGLAAGAINQRHQLVQPALWVKDWSDVTVLEPAPAESAVPIISGADLLSFRVTGQGGHRVRVSGKVLASFPNGEVYVRDGDIAVCARLANPAAIAPGSQIEVIGFPAMQGFSASLSDAVVLRQEHASVPPAVPVSLTTIFDGARDNDLISLVATVAGAFRTEDGGVLVLQDQGRSIRAYLPDLALEQTVGSQVQVTGICLVESTQAGGFRSKPVGVGLKLRSAADVSILHLPPWWTARKLGVALAGLSSLMLVAGLWIASLKRQVRRQTAALRDRIQTEAALEERQRIARGVSRYIGARLGGAFAKA